MERRAALLSRPGGREGCKERAERARRCRNAPWADLMAVDMEVQGPWADLIAVNMEPQGGGDLVAVDMEPQGPWVDLAAGARFRDVARNQRRRTRLTASARPALSERDRRTVPAWLR